MKVSKARIIALLLAVLLVVGGLSAYLAARKIVPTMLSANIEELLAQASGQPVSIGGSAVELFPSMAIVIRDVRVGTPDKPLVNAHRVKAHLSLWEALFGRVELTVVDLENPLIYLDYEALKKLKLKQEKGEAPSVSIRGGVIRLPGKERRMVLEAINGTVKKDHVSLKALVLGGETSIKADLTDTGWKGRLTMGTMDLARISSDFQGSFAVNMDFDLSGDRTASSLSIRGEHLRLPWAEPEIPTFEVSLTANGNEGRLTLEKISVVTPLVQVSGTGVLRDIRKGTGAFIALDLKSGVFDYEDVLRFVPTAEFEPWLTELLTAQIRGGLSRYTAARFQGTVQQLITFDRFLDRIYVVQEAMGQSFGAGPGVERITGVTGQIIYTGGGVYLKNLRGSVRSSVLQKLDLSFPGVLSPFWVIGVDAEIDMAARDFLDAWNAAGMPRYVIGLFGDISRVQAGRIRGRASVVWDERRKEQVQARGRIDLENCSYTWGSQAVTGHSGVVVSPDFGAPMTITSRLTAGSRVVRSLNITLVDPFDTMRSTFEASIGGLLDTEDFHMGKGTTVLLKGTGTGTSITATAEVTAESMTLFDMVFRQKDRPIQLKASLKGPLLPEMSLKIQGEARVSPGRLGISGLLTDKGADLRLQGSLPLDRFEAVRDGKARPLSGRLRGDLSIAVAEKVFVKGTLVCGNALLPVKGTFVKLTGPVALAGTTLSGKRLRVTTDDLKLRASDWSLDLSGAPVFKGDVTVDGLKLPLAQDQGGTPADFKDLTARGRLKILNLDLYDIPVEEAQADVSLAGGVATLSGITMKGQTVSATGSLTTDSSGIRSFDTEFSLKNVNITRFLERLTSEENWIRGNMDLEGKLSGSRESVNGTVRMDARNGRLKRYVIISRVFAVLNVYKIVRSMDLELTSKNFPYNRISATFNFKDSLVSFNDMYFDSNSLQFSAVGSYSLKTGEIDAVMGVQPFETIDKAIHMIPLIGWILTGDRGELFIVSMKITGNADDPKVAFAPVQTVSDPVRKSLARALRLPSELLKDARDLIPKKDTGKKE
ncbi:MAG TPA: AsmA-like C-terminal domain-containing protein [Deltaproteobacteria bacterium]|nr:AsmA-like C-terminal domain-containing protein [Deltaproteobacteria bacterium]HOI07931.1 AsmA-like C-terminal domain-containing protein [Deltaproteobacteria bacterium]